MRVFDHPNIADTDIIRIPLYASGAAKWPDARPFEIEVYDDPNEAPYYDAAAHRLRVPLPKAVRARLRLSMTLTDDALSLLGVFQWLAPADQAAQRGRALSGQHWMLTPWTVVEAVHAVQRPLLDPQFMTLSILTERAGQTSALPSAQIRCSIDSTDRLDLYGEWHEPIDDPSKDGSGPGDRQRRDVAFQVKVTGPKQYAGTDGVAPGAPEHSIPIPTSDVIAINSGAMSGIAIKAHEFHDTRYRRIEYWFDATSRFREFLPGQLLTTLEGGERVPTDANIKVTGAAPGHVDSERRATAGPQGPVRRPDVRVAPRSRRARDSFELATRRRIARVSRPWLERLGLRRNARLWSFRRRGLPTIPTPRRPRHRTRST